MKKSGTMRTSVLLLLLLAVGVAAVLLVHYPEMQEKFKLFLENMWERVSTVCHDLSDYFFGSLKKG